MHQSVRSTTYRHCEMKFHRPLRKSDSAEPARFVIFAKCIRCSPPCRFSKSAALHRQLRCWRPRRLVTRETVCSPFSSISYLAERRVLWQSEIFVKKSALPEPRNRSSMCDVKMDKESNGKRIVQLDSFWKSGDSPRDREDNRGALVFLQRQTEFWTSEIFVLLKLWCP